MEDSLKTSAESGDVEALYSILSEDPYILDRIDMISFVDNPLHIAAAAGNTHFAMEIASLKPSLAWKLSRLGLSPMHLALQNGHNQLVRSMLTIDSEFVRIKAKGRVTPLHYVAQIEDVDLLADFLSVCPSSIEDLTIQCETAVHIAVKNCRLSAFKVLLGWLKRVNKEGILNWKDEDGSTALHFATATNQLQVMKSVISYVDVNAKNFCGLTAIDMFVLQRDSLDREVGKVLHRANAKGASELDGSSITRAAYLSRDLSFWEKQYKNLGTVVKGQENLTDLRNVILVVATLIATAAYQAALSPPGGYWQEDSPPPPPGQNTSTIISTPQFRAGKMILASNSDIIAFYICNSLAFHGSLSTIFIVIAHLPCLSPLFIAGIFLVGAYYYSLAGTFPHNKAFVCTSFIVFWTGTAIPWLVLLVHAKLERLVDTVKGILG